MVVNKGGHKLISHGGGIEGFTTYLGYYPEDRVTVAVLCDLGGPAPQGMGRSLGAVVHGEQTKLPSERTAIAGERN